MNSKLTPIQRREAQEMYKEGLSSRDIAREFGVCQVVILDLINGRTYGGEYKCEVRARGVARGSKRGLYKWNDKSIENKLDELDKLLMEVGHE